METADAPDLKPWAESTARACERAYAMINDELGSDGSRPPRRIWLALSTSYRGVAKMSGDHIVGSADHFRGHRKDVGAIVHETVHVARAIGAEAAVVAGGRDLRRRPVLPLGAGEPRADRPRDGPLSTRATA